jgi:tetratricopeptide (TPR) repeat protein
LGDSDSPRRYGNSDQPSSRSRYDFPRKFDTPRRFREDEPRRERDQRIRGNAPVIDNDVTGDELGPELIAELKSLPVGLTISVAQHLAMSERYLSINSELALVHALHAKALAGRLACVREIVGVAYYANENWSSALNEFRAARRLAKSDYLIPMMADCERGLGKHDSALKLLISAEARSLTGIERIEAVIVEAGTRNDLKEHDAALLALKVPALAGFPDDMSAYARLCFVYAQTLEFLNRGDEAISWYQKADSADPAATSAGEKIADQDRTLFVDDLDYEL